MTMANDAVRDDSPAPGERKPKGILKNAGQVASPDLRTLPASDFAAAPISSDRPAISHELSEREVTQMNTNINAGPGRRNSSGPRASTSRRQSGIEGQDAASPRLKWDEANLYLNEGQMGGKMKIDEPKTPYAGRYEPEDETEVENENQDEHGSAAIDPNAIRVDELEQGIAVNGSSRTKHTKMDDIPGLELGEPELGKAHGHGEDNDRRVILDPDRMDVDGARHGEEPADMSPDERAKHRKFEQARRKHYEMKNVKGLLGHSEVVDGVDEDA